MKKILLFLILIIFVLMAFMTMSFFTKEKAVDTVQSIPNREATNEVIKLIDVNGVVLCDIADAIDGDTILCLKNKSEQIKVKLFGIDAPELDQPYGQEAKQLLNQMLHEDIFISIRKITKDNTYLVDINYIDTLCREPITSESECTTNLENINSNMIETGHAWYDLSEEENDPNFQTDERNARYYKNGLWSQSNPIPPWEWRKQKEAKYK